MITLRILVRFKDSDTSLVANAVKYWGWRKNNAKKVLTVHMGSEKIGLLLYRYREIGHRGIIYNY